MDRTERFYKIDQLLNARRSVSMATLIEELGVSRATVKRDLEYMKDRLNAPITWDRGLRGYRLEHALSTASRYRLPGLWLNAREIHALLTMHALLSDIGEGLLAPHVQPLLARLDAVLEGGDTTAEELRRRIRILHMGARPPKPAHFEAVASATLRRRRLCIVYCARSSATETRREISPQRLVYYRDNWYLDAWCHLRGGLRNFAVDSIGAVEILQHRAQRADIG